MSIYHISSLFIVEKPHFNFFFIKIITQFSKAYTNFGFILNLKLNSTSSYISNYYNLLLPIFKIKMCWIKKKRFCNMCKYLISVLLLKLINYFIYFHFRCLFNTIFYYFTCLWYTNADDGISCRTVHRERSNWSF